MREVARQIGMAGYCLGNADVTIIAQAPKMAPHVSAMRQLLAQDHLNAEVAKGLYPAQNISIVID